MSNLLSRLEFDDQYEVISEGTLKERFVRYFKDVKAEDLKIDQKIDIETEASFHFKEELLKIKREDKRILIISDYDADGIMALSIMMRLLDHLKIKANYYIPSRSNEGYGISLANIKMAKEYGFDYIMTLDNGIIAHEAIGLARSSGIKTIVIDHHEFVTPVNADIIIHPAFLDDYHKGMCTGGLAYGLSKLFYDDPYSLVLAMIASIGDVVEVFRANRKIIIDGLNYYNSDELVASNIKVLANLNKEATAEDIAFKAVPKINALSRMDPLCNVNHYISYFKEGKLDIAMTEKIIQINDLRRSKTNTMVKKAQKALNDDGFIILESEDYLLGLCGIVAGKLAEEYKRPAIILSKDGQYYKGSGRSYGDFDLYGYLSTYKDSFIEFGGHQKAIGITLDDNGLGLLKDVTKDFKYEGTRQKIKIIRINEDELTLDNMAYIRSFEPYGEGMKKPLFYIDSPNIKGAYLIKGQYPKFSLASGHELFSFDKDMYGEIINGAIGTLDVSDRYRSKITMSLKQIVL